MAKKEVKYSQAMDELNDILSDLESQAIDVDQVSTKVKRGVELIKIGKDKINKTELEVRKIVKEFEKQEDEK